MYRTSMAVNRSTGADNESADFIQVLAFDKKAEFLSKWVPKGTAFFAEGRLSVGTYTKMEKQNLLTNLWQIVSGL